MPIYQLSQLRKCQQNKEKKRNKPVVSDLSSLLAQMQMCVMQLCCILRDFTFEQSHYSTFYFFFLMQLL